MASSWTPSAAEVPINRGDFVGLPKMDPDDKGRSTRGTNAYLANAKDQRVYMWVNGINADFGLSGDTAQSRKRRTFFPHNFNQPTVTISGQTPNVFQQNRLMFFIRDAQKRGLIDRTNILRFRLLPGGKDTRRRIQRGRHNGIALDGYINAVEVGAERFVTAGDYQLQFTVTRAFNFLGMADDVITGIQLKSFLQNIVGMKFTKGTGEVPTERSKPDREAPPTTDDGSFFPTSL